MPPSSDSAPAARPLLGIDTGGTFTDFILLKEGQLTVHKVLSTPEAPELAILQGLKALGLQDEKVKIVHGSTVATNAALEGKGVRTLYITNHGMGDLLTIGRQTRRELYQLQPQKPLPPVPKDLILETGGRIGADGTLLEPLTMEDLATIRRETARLQPEAVVINLLFSFLDDRYERAIAQEIPPAIFVSRSSAVLPEIREYERGITTWINGWIGPRVQGYLQRLQQALPEAKLSVMESSGMTVSASEAGERAVHMLLSGPAGGLAGAKAVAAQAGRGDILTFDMGGTSTDVASIAGEIELTTEGRIGPYPVAVPMVNMHTIGSGGGSIVRVDSGGMLLVGPESAGADPGPACYGRGGRLPTVTDANLILGRLLPDAFLGGQFRLDTAAATAAMQPIAAAISSSIEATAEGVIAIANEQMGRALRVISVERGIDPRDTTLVSFGGAGGLHVTALAQSLGCRQAMVPIHGGVLSALGMLLAPRGRELAQTIQQPLHHFNFDTLQQRFRQLIRQGVTALKREGISGEACEAQCRLDLRYQGQSHSLSLPWLDGGGEGGLSQLEADFHQLHRLRYGHALDRPLEIATLRLRLTAVTPPLELPPLQRKQRAVRPFRTTTHHNHRGEKHALSCYQRTDLPPGTTISGPALVCEQVATTYLEPNWHCHVDHLGNLLLSNHNG
ncbi:MAG: hydantoinase/oxoprolinase family protein [Gammaproteobacteria bacterium]|nr:hydantoinase/oxoprolinase family protein [Gammaproteobacteria bacterium]